MLNSDCDFYDGNKVKIPSEIKPHLNLDDIYAFASTQIHRLFPDDVKSEIQSMEVDENGDVTFFEDSEDQKVVKRLSLHEQAQLKWKEQQERKKIKSAQKKPDFVIDLCKTYAKCGSPGDIPPLLKKLFNALQSIPPTSVESERAFSTLQICAVFNFVPLSTVISLYGLHFIALYSPMCKLQ